MNSSVLSEELLEMCQLFNKNVEDIDLQQLQISLNYTKEREYSLGANVVRFQAMKQLSSTVPDYINERLSEPEITNFGLAELCLPQQNSYDPMPEHKWRKIKEALNDVSSDSDIVHLIRYCDERYLYFGWEQMREALMILGRPQFRAKLWVLEGPKVSSIENYGCILEVLDKEERDALRSLYWK